MVATHKQHTRNTESQYLQDQTKNRPTTEFEELVPAEVHARKQREGEDLLKSPQQKGATVDQEGLTNNYGIEPQEYYTTPPTAYEAREYLVQGIAAFAFVIGLVAIAVLAS